MFKVVRKLHKILPIFALASFAALPLLANGSASASENVTTNVTVEPSLTVTIPSTPITLNLNPASTTSGNNNITITVGTNNATGYKTVMTSRSGGTDLVDATDTSLVIPTLDTGTSYASLSAFPANHWGYKQDSGNYKPFETDTTILESTTFANVDTTTLNFATKIDYLQEAGAYSTTLVFDTVVNPWAAEMQNLDPTLCTATPLEVLDTRDGQVYTIQRLRDGNCWMMDNLNLGDIDNYPLITTQLDSTNSNVSTPISNTEFLGWKKTAGGSNVATPEFIPVAGTDAVSDIPYGTLYNYCAITGKTICANTNTSATYDICPAGWRLPTGGSSSEFTSLYGYYNSYNAMRNSIANDGAAFALSGTFYDGGSPTYIGSAAKYWSSTSANASATYALRLGVSGSAINTDSTNSRATGYPVRCILKDSRTLSSISTMQEMNSQIAKKMSNGDTATLRDTRDNQDYTIKKINGVVWMTRNLAIGCDGTGNNYGSNIVSKNLRPSDTNISSNWTIPNNSLSLGADFSEPRLLCDSTYGAWYNYAAATARTITDSSNTEEAMYSICPLGWRLPTYAEQSSIANTTYQSAFNPVYGGYYTGSGRQESSSNGFWWSSTAANGTNRRDIFYHNSILQVGYDGRTAGAYIRCVTK